MADKHIWEIESASTMSDEDRLLIVIGTSEYLINKSDFKKTLGGLSSVDTNKLSKIIIDGDGTRFLANNGEYISLKDVFDKKHNHDNKTIIDKFTINAETSELMYDGKAIGSNYELPVATTEMLGGVKPDGITITIDESGVIKGATTYELPTASGTILGGVKIDNDTIKINDGVISADIIGNWSAGVNYPVGYFVVYEETLYECIIANNDTVWTVDNWLLIGGKSTGMTINNWTTNTKYMVGNLVINGTTIYQCNTEHTSGETFDNTNWTAMTGTKGDKGEDGFSPIANVVATETGATITITDATETTTANINNGADGITPHIDETTKHWIIGEEDTGIIAEAVSTVITNAVVYNGTLNVDNWIGETVPYTQDVIINGITADSRPFLYVKYSSDDATTILEEQKQWSYITRAVTSDNTITFYCYKDKPTITLNFEAEVR